jgi:hypothetical protein
MSMMSYLFPLNELKKMDPEHLEMLHDAIQHHVHNSPEIRKILRAELRPVYDQLKKSKEPRKAKKSARPKK